MGQLHGVECYNLVSIALVHMGEGRLEVHNSAPLHIMVLEGVKCPCSLRVLEEPQRLW